MTTEEKVTKVPDAWVQMPEEAAARAAMGSGGPYDFGFLPAMARLVMSHMGVAPFFGALFQQIMFVPGALTRAEREMVASVAAAAQDCHY